MIGKTKLYIAPRSHGAALMGCKPMGGWWTDLQKAVQSGTATALQLVTAWKAGNITEEQYIELEKARIAAQGGTTSTVDIVKYALIGGLALLAVVALKKA